MIDLLKTEVAHRVTVLKAAIKRLEDGVRRNDVALITSSRVACVSVDTWVRETAAVSVPPHALAPVERSVPEAPRVHDHVSDDKGDAVKDDISVVVPDPSDRQDSEPSESDASSETEQDELEVQSGLEPVKTDKELHFIRHAPLHERADVTAFVKFECRKLCDLLVAYEALRQHCKRENFTSKGRPKQVSNWIQHRRDPVGGPRKLSKHKFGAAWRAWWWSANPVWRRMKSPELRLVAAADISQWATMDRGGRSGIRVAVMTLFWWAPKGAIDEDSVWVECAADVSFVLQDLIRLRTPTPQKFPSSSNTVMQDVLLRKSTRHSTSSSPKKRIAASGPSTVSVKKRRLTS